MADNGSSSTEPTILQHHRERSESMSLGNNTAAAPSEGDAHSNGAGAAPSTAAPSNTLSAVPLASRDVSQDVKDVLASEIGVSTMLNRLKQSIASAKEFAMFLKKRSQLEEEHATGLRKLCRMSQDNMRRAEHRSDTFAAAYQDVMIIHDRMSENALQFAASLYHMQEDLVEMAAIAEKSRKGWKQNGLAAEERVHEIEQAMRKSKAKYDALAEEYGRVKTGDARPGGRGIFKTTKSAAQQEEELLRKVQAADQDYRQKVQTLQNERAALTANTRPEAIQALQDLVRECDAGLALQLQKFASFNEKLLLSNGLTISPIKSHGSENSPAQRSLREIASSVDNDKDFNEYILGFHNKLPHQMSEPKYERHPVLNAALAMHPMYPSQQQGQHPVQQPSPMAQPVSQPTPLPTGQQTQRPDTIPGMRKAPGSAPPQPPGSSMMGSPMAASSMGSPPVGPSPMGQSFGTQGGGVPALPSVPMMSGAQPLPTTQQQQQQHERSYSQGNLMGQNKGPQQQYPVRNSAGPAPRFTGTISSKPAPQLGNLPFQLQASPDQQLGQPRGPQPGTNPLQQHPSATQYGPSQTRSVSPPTNKMDPPSRPVFGVSLEKLYERDQNPVPLVVYKCIQAIDLFGLNVEGIYRLSGSQTHVHKLRTLFDTAGVNDNTPATDFRNPENFFHDVNSVAGLLKQFFRDLPDPLLTKRAYNAFIEAAKHDDNTVRRDSLHAIINNLPDPNYATLKALTLHLHRVMENSVQNRMGSQNLAIVFGPTLLGGGMDGNQGVENAAWHSRVIDTILQNTYQIFDED